MYLYNIILAIFSMYSLHSADIQASKHLSARVHPQTIPKKPEAIRNTDDPFFFFEYENYIKQTDQQTFLIHIWFVQLLNQLSRLLFSIFIYLSDCSSIVYAHSIYTSSSDTQTHLSVMAICSSIADPVLAFQLPEMEVLLQRDKTERGQKNNKVK